jgi:hypothetical protein
MGGEASFAKGGIGVYLPEKKGYTPAALQA